jgi:hypothetical protein
MVEFTIRPKNIKMLWDDLIKLGDDISDINIAKRLKDVFDEDILLKFKNLDSFTNIRKDIQDIFNNANPGYGVQAQRDQLVKLLTDKKISQSVSDGFDGFIESLEKDIRDFKIKGGETVEDFLRKRQESITGLYEELEKETAEILGDPKSHNITNQQQMDEFAKEFKSTFGDDLSFLKNDAGDDIITDTFKKTYDPDNINIKNVVDDVDLDAPTKNRLHFDQNKLNGILQKLYKWFMDKYNIIFNKFLYSNAYKRRQKWLTGAGNKIGKDSNWYKYGAKPAIIGFNKILTAFDTVLMANTTFLLPFIRSVRKIFASQSEFFVKYPKLSGWLDTIMGWVSSLVIYVYSYFPIAFWEGDEERAEEARSNMAGVQTMMSWVGIDASGLTGMIDDLADWISEWPCKIDPEECEKNKAELENLQNKLNDTKKIINNQANNLKTFSEEKIKSLEENYKKAKECLDSLGDEKTKFLKSLKDTSEDSGDQVNDPMGY